MATSWTSVTERVPSGSPGDLGHGDQGRVGIQLCPDGRRCSNGLSRERCGVSPIPAGLGGYSATTQGSREPVQPPAYRGARSEPCLARPVPFRRYGFLPPPLTWPRVFAACCPAGPQV